MSLTLAEYRNKTLNKLLGGPLAATYYFFVTIFSLGILRDHLYVIQKAGGRTG